MPFVNATTGGTTFNASTAVPLTAFSTTTGNCIVLMVSYSNAISISSVTDTAGNTYTSRLTSANGTVNIAFYVAQNIVGNASNVITINASGTGWVVCGIAQQFSGVYVVSALDGTPVSNSSAGVTTYTGPSLSTTYRGDTIVGAFTMNTSTTFSLGSGYSNLTNNTINTNLPMAMETLIQSSPGSVSPTIGSTTTGFTITGHTFALRAQPVYKMNNIGLRPHPFSPGIAR